MYLHPLRTSPFCLITERQASRGTQRAISQASAIIAQLEQTAKSCLQNRTTTAQSAELSQPHPWM